ncbi:MAG: hypothetical protein ACKOC0_05545, partial [Cytophagales bacterium]
LILALDGCFTAPTYPIVPKISFNKLAFEREGSFGTLVLTLDFTDGDGDLGIDDSFQTDTAFVQQYYLLRPNQDFSNVSSKLFPYVSNVEYRNLSRLLLVNYGYVQKNPSFGVPKVSKLNLPTGSSFPGLNCKNWNQRRVGGNGNDRDAIKDTVFTVLNESYYNIFVNLLIDDGTGNFKVFDPDSGFPFPTCADGNFSGRFPVLSSDPGKKAPLDGTLNYRMKSLLTELIIGSKRFKLRVQISDRAYNRSNIIETEPTTLAAIRRI